MVSHIDSTENYGSNDLAIGEGFMEEVAFKIREKWNFSPTPAPTPALGREDVLEVEFNCQWLMI